MAMAGSGHRIFSGLGRLSVQPIALPDGPFVELQLLLFFLPKRTVAIKEELIKLRWFDGGSAEHRMHLAAVMDLMFEQVQQQPVDALAHDTVGPHQVDAAGEVCFPQGFAERHQPLVGLGLALLQLGKGQGFRKVLYLAVPVAFQSGEVITVHFQDVAQRGLDGREEPRARRRVVCLAQLRAGAEQSDRKSVV